MKRLPSHSPDCSRDVPEFRRTRARITGTPTLKGRGLGHANLVGTTRCRRVCRSVPCKSAVQGHVCWYQYSSRVLFERHIIKWPSNKPNPCNSLKISLLSFQIAHT